jgi:hypothetical protein
VLISMSKADGKTTRSFGSSVLRQETLKKGRIWIERSVFDFSRNSCLWRLDHSLHHDIEMTIRLDALGKFAHHSRLDLSGNR